MSLADLGRRAVACKRWRWMPGMLLCWKIQGTYRGRVCHLESGDSGASPDVYCEGRGDRFDGVLEAPNCFPDLSDPATLGCLLHLVREWHGYPVHTELVQPLANRWAIVDDEQDWPGQGEGPHGEAAALVMALEAAP